jgi:hypothetical protein
VEFPVCKITIPEEDEVLQFEDYSKLAWNYLCVYSDIECIFEDDKYIIYGNQAQV